MKLRQAIQEVQKMGLDHGFTIIIVGGALVRLIGPKTTIKKIDTKTKTIFLSHPENPSTKREDGKTTVDIDCIAFSNSDDPFTKEIVRDFEKLYKNVKQLQKELGFPVVSLEPVLYHPYFPRPNQLTQFVSSIESYHDTDFFFRLGGIKQDVKKESLAFWTYEFGEDKQNSSLSEHSESKGWPSTGSGKNSLTSFSPIAIQRRYSIRGFSAKPKDMEKIWGNSPFARFVADFNKKTNDMYLKDYTEWDGFAANLQTTTQPSMQIKRRLWNLYWTTIGTYLAHGTGIVGKLLLPLGNTFFAGK